jgi:hypothetical protein
LSFLRAHDTHLLVLAAGLANYRSIMGSGGAAMYFQSLHVLLHRSVLADKTYR